jgi:hypothetical protein
MSSTHVKASPVTIHEQRVDTYIDRGPVIRKYLGWNRQNEALSVSRVVTTYRQRVVDGDPGEIETAQRVYARTTLKDGSPSAVETAIKPDEWTPEVAGLLATIALDNLPVLA